MGIEIPEEYGGSGGSFFQCILAVEELSAVDPSAGVIADVQNTIVNNAILRWANPAQKKKYLPRLATDTLASYALSEAGSGSDGTYRSRWNETVRVGIAELEKCLAESRRLGSRKNELQY